MTSTPSRRTVIGGAGAAWLASVVAQGCASVSGAEGAGGDAAAALSAAPASAPTPAPLSGPGVTGPVIASTWGFGQQANAAAWAALEAGAAHPLDAAEAGVMVIEADAGNHSVGLGGFPNAEGVVQLDAAVMRGDQLRCGGVAALTQTLHPVSVARAVMERSIHVLLVGEGAVTFARQMGFPEQDLLTPAAKEAWQRWLRQQTRPPPEEDHDTIGQIVLDRGRFGVAVSTSGRAWKLPGRVGDSPIVGAGLYCDDRFGAAVSTGVGEEAIRVCGSFAVVEAMRRGASVAQACHEITARVAESLSSRGLSDQVAFLAMDPAGNTAGCCTTGAFRYALTDTEGTRMLASEKVS